MPKAKEDWSQPEGRTCRQEGCGKTFVPETGQQRYCEEHRRPSTRKGATTPARAKGAGRKRAENARIDAELDRPIRPAKPPRRAKVAREKNGAATSPATSSSAPVFTLDDALSIIELAGVQVLRKHSTPEGMLLLIGGVS